MDSIDLKLLAILQAIQGKDLQKEVELESDLESDSDNSGRDVDVDK